MKNDDLLPWVIKTTFPLKYTANHNNTLGHNLFREICRMKQAPDCLRLELLFKHLGLPLAMITKKGGNLHVRSGMGGIHCLSLAVR